MSPELRRGRHDPIALKGRPGVRVTKDRCVEEMGFTLHANTCAGALDQRGREALLEYILRPAAPTTQATSPGVLAEPRADQGAGSIGWPLAVAAVLLLRVRSRRSAASRSRLTGQAT